METDTVPHALTAGKRLVIVAPNWLGDAVMALPAIADLRRCASAVVAVAARPSIAPLFTMAEGIDEILELEPGRGAVERLRAGRFDAALLLPNSFQSALMVRRAGIAERWGYRADGRTLLLTRAVRAPRRVHQGAYYQQLVRELGIPSGPLAPRLAAPLRARQGAAELLQGEGWDGRQPLVALAPGAAYGGAKRWPLERFAELSAALAADGVGTVLVGGRGDAWGRAAHPGGPINLIGRTDLPTLAGVLAHCRALVSNDSGAMHVGAALGIRVTALFGPTNERETHPLAADAAMATIVTRDVWCRPCMLRECPLVHRCMRGIGVDMVLPSVRSAIAAGPAAS